MSILKNTWFIHYRSVWAITSLKSLGMWSATSDTDNVRRHASLSSTCQNLSFKACNLRYAECFRGFIFIFLYPRSKSSLITCKKIPSNVQDIDKLQKQTETSNVQYINTLFLAWFFSPWNAEYRILPDYLYSHKAKIRFSVLLLFSLQEWMLLTTYEFGHLATLASIQ